VKKTAAIWALSLEVEGDDMRKPIANLTENARLFDETRKLLASGGKVLEVVGDEQEQVPEVAAEFYAASANGSSIAEPAEAGPPPSTTPLAPTPRPTPELPSPQNSTVPKGGNGSPKSPTNRAASLLNPLQEPVPENAAAQYAVASALARCASDTNFDRICLYLNRLPTEKRRQEHEKCPPHPWSECFRSACRGGRQSWRLGQTNREVDPA
jgi:hypothetical protein